MLHRRAAQSASYRKIVSRYQDAHDRRDTDVALSAFTADARVVDDGHEFHGTDEVRTWLATAASEFTFTRTLVSAEAAGPDTWVVVNHLEGDFPGRVVDLRYRFGLTGGLISELVIAP
jgi:ketosteroid isomerase-like protein